MAELKTKQTKQSVGTFLNGLAPENMRRDCETVLRIMKRATKSEPKMWGTSIVGFGKYHYKNKSGRAGEWFITGFSPRKLNLTLYIMPGFDRYDDLMKKLGKYQTGKSCLYLKKLDEVNLAVLEKLIQASVKHMRELQKQ